MILPALSPSAWLAALAALIVTHLGAYFYGQHVEAGDQAQERLDDALAYAGEILARQARVDTLAADLEQARAAQKPKDRVITREVVRYETIVPPARRCDLDGAWRLLHDAAASGVPPDPAGLAAAAAAPVTDAAALDTVAGNYEQCREYIDQVTGWQRWWEAVRPAE